MSGGLAPVHDFASSVRVYVPELLAGSPEPHTELLAMIWGPRFDRLHGLELVAGGHGAQLLSRQSLLQVVRDAADRFDRLDASAQQGLRRLVLRHRALSAAREV